MAKINVEWFKTKYPISIREYAEKCGFNLTGLENGNISEENWEWIDSKIRLRILNDLKEQWNDIEDGANRFLKVKRGVYVITLAQNISIDYSGHPSQVIYIGRGNLRSRISSHLRNWIRYFSESLQDISFNIWLTEIRVKGSPNAFKDLEYDLLDEFFNRYGELPIQNTKYGDNFGREHEYNMEWRAPLNNPRNIHNGWTIKPLRNNPWFKDVEE